MSDRRSHTWPYALARGDVDHVVVVFSDVEMGAGGPTDDFPQSDFLGELIEGYNEPPFDELPVTIVFNGDTFDLLKTSYHDTYPTRITADVAVGKLLRVAAAHVELFERLRRFVRHEKTSPTKAARRLVFLTGNHDLELLFPEVRQLLRGLCGDAAEFPGHSLRLGDMQIEHGFQADPLFTFDEEAPFVELGEERLLNLPWGAVALLEVAIPLAPVFYALDRLKPRERVLDALPEVRDLLLSSFWRYWTRDYWRDFFADADPMKKMSWTMLREIVYRFGTGHADVSMGDTYQKKLTEDDGLRLFLIGHQHEPGWWSRGDRKVLRTGCFRNEFSLTGTSEYRLLPKVFAEVYMKAGHAVRSHLVEVDAPPPPPGYMPASITELRGVAASLLEAGRHDVKTERAAQAAQEAAEARSGGVELEGEPGFAFLRTLKRALPSDW